ncbi:MAG TPA: hypothetical protein VF521_08735, partial [Pyrinomonadaceae bacterium]
MSDFLIIHHFFSFPILSPLQALGQAGHLAAGRGVVMRVAVAFAVAGAAHERRDGVAEVERDGLARRLGGVLGGGHVGALDGVRLGRAGEVDGRLRERVKRLGQPDELRYLRGGGGLHHRLRVGEPHVFRSQYAKTARYENRVGPALYEARE